MAASLGGSVATKRLWMNFRFDIYGGGDNGPNEST